MRTRNHQAPLGLDLTKILTEMGYIKGGKKREVGTGTARFKQHDQRTTAQLQEQRWNGIRANNIWNRFEIWFHGQIHSTLTYAEVALNPDRLNTWYCEVFGLDKINLDAKAQRDIEALKERKAMMSEPELQRAADALASDDQKRVKRHMELVERDLKKEEEKKKK